MPTLTGTLAEITGSPIDPDSLHEVTVRAPSRRASLADQERLVSSVPVPVEVSAGGVISVDLEPGPAILLVKGEGYRDPYELGVTEDMTLLSEALAEAAPDRSWVESVMVRLRGEAVAAAAAAGEDRTQTGLDRVATGEDREQTGLDRVATGEDRVATGEDRQQTGLDRVAAETARGEAVTAAGDVAAAVAQFDVDFAADMAQFAGIRDEMNVLATDVALDANRAEAAANEFGLTATSSTLAPGSQATVTVTGDGPAYSLAFGVPQGEKGDQGEISQAQLDAAVASLVDGAPEALDTLTELAAALGNDPNFATTVSTAIGERAKIDGAPAQYDTLGKLVTALQNHELGGSTDASLLTGALTDQVDASSALFDWTALLGSESGHQTLVVGFASFAAILGEAFADKGHTHTADEVGAVANLGGITGAKRVTQAEYDALTPDPNVMYIVKG